MDYQNRALLNVDMPSWAYTSNGVQLLTDGDMEAAGVAAWLIAAGAVPTKEVLLPHSGLQWLKVSFGGVANPYVYQNAMVAGSTYRLRGWAKGDGTASPKIIHGAGVVAWTGTSSTSWQYFDVYLVATNTWICFQVITAGAGYAGFDDLRLELCPASTRNLGSLGGTVQLGDGVTPATFPTQVFPHGMSFDGANSYLNFLRPAELSFATLAGNELPFSTECLVRVNSYASIRSLFSKGIIGASMEYMSYLNGGQWEFYLISSSQIAWYRLVVTGLPNAAPVGTVHHLVTTYDGTRVATGVVMYVDGVSRVVTNVPAGVYTRMVNFGADAVYSLANGSGAVPILGSTYNLAIYPFVLEPGEIAQLYRKRLALLQRGA